MLMIQSLGNSVVILAKPWLLCVQGHVSAAMAISTTPPATGNSENTLLEIVPTLAEHGQNSMCNYCRKMGVTNHASRNA